MTGARSFFVSTCRPRASRPGWPILCHSIWLALSLRSRGSSHTAQPCTGKTSACWSSDCPNEGGNYQTKVPRRTTKVFQGEEKSSSKPTRSKRDWPTHDPARSFRRIEPHQPGRGRLESGMSCYFICGPEGLRTGRDRLFRSYNWNRCAQVPPRRWSPPSKCVSRSVSSGLDR